MKKTKEFDIDCAEQKGIKYIANELYQEISDDLSFDKADSISTESIKQKVVRNEYGIRVKLKECFYIDTKEFSDKFSVLKLIKLYYVTEEKYKCSLSQIFSIKKELGNKHEEALVYLKSELEKGLSAEFMENTKKAFRSLEDLWTEIELAFIKKHLYNPMNKMHNECLDVADVDRLIEHFQYRTYCVREDDVYYKEYKGSIIEVFYVKVLQLEFQMNHNEKILAIEAMKSATQICDLSEYYEESIQLDKLYDYIKANKNIYSIITNDKNKEKRRRFLELVKIYIDHIDRFVARDPSLIDLSTNYLYIISFLQELWYVDQDTEKINTNKFGETRPGYSVFSGVTGTYDSAYFDAYWSLRVLRRMCLNFNLQESADNLIAFEKVYHEFILKLSKFNNIDHMKAVHDYSLINISLLLMPDGDNEKFIEKFSDRLSKEIGYEVSVCHSSVAEYTQTIRDSFKIIDKKAGINKLISFAKEISNNTSDITCTTMKDSPYRKAKVDLILNPDLLKKYSILSAQYTFQFIYRSSKCIKNQSVKSDNAHYSKLIIGAVSYYPSTNELKSIIGKYTKNITLQSLEAHYSKKVNNFLKKAYNKTNIIE